MCSFISHWEPIANDSLPSGVNDRVIISSCFLHLVSRNDAVSFANVFSRLSQFYSTSVYFVFCHLGESVISFIYKKQPERRGL